MDVTVLGEKKRENNTARSNGKTTLAKTLSNLLFKNNCNFSLHSHKSLFKTRIYDQDPLALDAAQYLMRNIFFCQPERQGCSYRRGNVYQQCGVGWV